MRHLDEVGGPPGPLVVDIGGLRRAGGRLGHVSQMIGTAHGSRNGRQTVLTPADNQAGPATSAATRSASSGWYSHLASLASRVATAGTDMTASANHFAGSDQASADRFRHHLRYGRDGDE